jgi:CRP-like cAMP-binding protein
MADDKGDPFDLASLRLPTDETVRERRLAPSKIQKRQRHFVMVPWTWIELLKGTNGQTYRVAMYLLYLHWKGNGAPIKLASGMLTMNGVPRETKRRALQDLERRGLVTVERRPRKSPLVRLLKYSVP